MVRKQCYRFRDRRKQKSQFDLIFFFFHFVKSICVTSKNKTNEAEEVTVVMLKIVTVFLEVLPHIP